MIDLTQLPPPDVIEALDFFETLFQSRKARLLAAAPPDLRAGLAAALQLDSEPLTMLLQEFAYNELLQRQRINEAARASLLAYAAGADLDNRAADYGVQRLLLQPANPDAVPPTPAEWEDDAALRRRCQMALEGLSVAGSRGAYLFHTLSASADIADASVDSPRFEALELAAELRRQLPADALVLRCSYDAGLSAPLPGDVAVAVLPRPRGGRRPAAGAGAGGVERRRRAALDRPTARAGRPAACL
ncbi:baseplate J/gp47 family protein [Chromobacterium haemolyticum]|nr:baseplate J/gp47 family protein [Chromobacterium haemolyticum]